MDILAQIEAFEPGCEQEVCDRAVLLDCLRTRPHIFERSDLTAHMTASAWVVDPAREKVLLIYHNIYNSWSWMGGHADGERDLLAVALREVREESGVAARPLLDGVFSLEVLTVDGHEKRGSYVPSHLHLNVSYLLEADDRQPLAVKPDENSGVRWFPVGEAVAASSEPWFRERIYPKLIARAARLTGKG